MKQLFHKGADEMQPFDNPPPFGSLDRWRGIGDPLADAVIDELAARDAAARQDLETGISAGLSTLAAPPPALRAFLESCEAASATETAAMGRGSEAYLSIGATWIALSLGPGSLTHTYSAPSIARVLADTGNLTRMAERRLLETGKWNTASVVPGALLVGAPGYVHNLQVRLLHARVRHALLRRGWDDRAGVPINQLELARTWLDFTFVPFAALDRLGIGFTAEELRDLYALWHRIAALLGVASELYQPVVDQASGARLLAAIDAQAPPPDDHSRRLTGAMLDAVATLLAPRLRVGRTLSLALARAILRRLHGNTLADQLGVPWTPVALALPAIVVINRLARRRLHRSPEQRRRAVAQTRAAFAEADRDFVGRTTYERALREPVKTEPPRTIAPR
ncbi:MAG TPA: oxygenase MpaB family protein [Sphingopyxis sp.]|uniref:oxygenase MpaB family protein n=1 Tax=Sphingopyxis sp. TaxID=1908224 RepID=UPI002E37FA77|nr:oxygenase MpaB family protein [Sphingopyxis sp.]HEX2813674.1 oxygenase MpaB family protein [Sphingopyxis sp.]